VGNTYRGSGESEEEEFALFFRLHEPRLRAFALRRTRSTVLADDLVGAVMVVAWQRFDAIPEEAAFGWLCGVASRVVLNDERGRRRRTRLVDRMIQERGPLSQHLDSQALLSEQREVLQTAFDQLNGDDQEVLRLSGWDGLSSKELALALDLHEVAARKRLSRARQRLKDQYYLLLRDDGAAASSSRKGVQP
jgi:RNA polymerase sigma-70 factor (ECF subfamily)